MFSVHATVPVNPLSIGINFAMYGDPSASNNQFVGDYGGVLPQTSGIAPFKFATNHKEDLLIEGMLNLGFALDAHMIALTVGLVANAAPDKIDYGSIKDVPVGGAAALQIGLEGDFKVGGGFVIIPHFILYKVLDVSGKPDKQYMNDWIKAGIGLGYNF
jgi:hypothetical protein